VGFALTQSLSGSPCRPAGDVRVCGMGAPVRVLGVFVRYPVICRTAGCGAACHYDDVTGQLTVPACPSYGASCVCRPQMLRRLRSQASYEPSWQLMPLAAGSSSMQT
jgi:hypothetical protein